MTYKIHHIGLQVPNIENAKKFYSDTFGWKITNERYEASKDDEIMKDIFGSSFKGCTMANVESSNNIGIELFEVPTNCGKSNFNSENIGFFHVALFVDDVRKVAEKVVKNGGSYMTNIHSYENENEYHTMIYVKDPFGIIYELYMKERKRHDYNA